MPNTPSPTSPTVDYVLTAFVASASTRKKVYGAFVLIGLILTGIIAYVGATGLDIPAWVIGGNAVYNMLSASGFVLAIGNTPVVAQTAHVTEELTTVEEVGPDLVAAEEVAEPSEVEVIEAEFNRVRTEA